MDSPRQNPRDLKDHKQTPSPSTSPNSSTSSTTNGPPSAPPSSSSLPPLTPKSNPTPTPTPTTTTPNPYPTTFVQADTQSFKQVVQMLTGSAETTAKRSTQAKPPNTNFAPGHPQKSQIPPINRPTKKPAFKLYERRSSMKNLKMISPLIPSFPNCPSPAASSPRQHHHQPEILSPSILDFPKLVISPVTPLSPDPFRSPSQLGISPEDRAIAEKGFYLHPPPRPTTPRDAEPPKLLPLFPLTSPRMESSAAPLRSLVHEGASFL